MYRRAPRLLRYEKDVAGSAPTVMEIYTDGHVTLDGGSKGLRLDGAWMEVMRAALDVSALRALGSRLGVGRGEGRLTVENGSLEVVICFTPDASGLATNLPDAARPWMDLLAAIATAARTGAAAPVLPNSASIDRSDPERLIITTGPLGRLLARYNEYNECDSARCSSVDRWLEVWNSGAIAIRSAAGPTDRGIEESVFEVGGDECERLADLIARAARAPGVYGHGENVFFFEAYAADGSVETRRVSFDVEMGARCPAPPEVSVDAIDALQEVLRRAPKRRPA